MLDIVYLAQTLADMQDEDKNAGSFFNTKDEAIEFATKTPSIVKIWAVNINTGEKEEVWSVESDEEVKEPDMSAIDPEGDKLHRDYPDLVEGIRDTVAEVKANCNVLKDVNDPTVEKLVLFYANENGLSPSKVSALDCADFYNGYNATGEILLELYRDAELRDLQMKELAIHDSKFMELVKQLCAEYKLDKDANDNVISDEAMFNVLITADLSEEQQDETMKLVGSRYYNIKEDFDISKADEYGKEGEEYFDPFGIDFPDDISKDEAEHNAECDPMDPACAGEKVPEVPNFDGSVEICGPTVVVEKSVAIDDGGKEELVNAEIQCEDDPETIMSALQELIDSLGLTDEVEINANGADSTEENHEVPESEPVADLTGEADVKVEIPAEVADEVKDADAVVVALDKEEEKESEDKEDKEEKDSDEKEEDEKEEIEESLKTKKFECYFEGELLGVVEAKNSQEAYIEMEERWPDHNYSDYDGCAHVYEIKESLEEKVEIEEGLFGPNYNAIMDTKTNDENKYQVVFGRIFNRETRQRATNANNKQYADITDEKNDLNKVIKRAIEITKPNGAKVGGEKHDSQFYVLIHVGKKGDTYEQCPLSFLVDKGALSEKATKDLETLISNLKNEKGLKVEPTEKDKSLDETGNKNKQTNTKDGDNTSKDSNSSEGNNKPENNKPAQEATPENNKPAEEPKGEEQEQAGEKSNLDKAKEAYTTYYKTRKDLGLTDEEKAEFKKWMKNAYKTITEGLEEDVENDMSDEEFLEELGKALKESRLEEASSAEKRAFENGGQDLDDLIDGRAIGRIKDPKARDAAVAAKQAGREDVVKQFTGERKENQAVSNYEKKAGQMSAAKTEEVSESWINYENTKNDADPEPKELQGADCAVKECPVNKVIAHCAEEKIDCEMKEPALEKPLAGDEPDKIITEEVDKDKIQTQIDN